MLSPRIFKNSDIPLYQQIYEYIKEEIRLGNLKKEESLPSKRNLARHLDLSVNTITKAYEILVDEGYLYSLERKGYFVSNIKNLATLQIEEKTEKISKKEEKVYKYNFRINEVDNDYFPKYTWRKLVSDIIYKEDWLNLKDSQGLYNLRYDITNYLRQSRDVRTNPENIIISSGTEYLLQMLLSILPKDSVFAVENPGYRALNQLFKTNNIDFIPINIDKSGLSSRDLENSRANIVLITPSHQFPTGVIMPINRRLQILSWADKNDRNYVIEDDYDSEFKYYGRPIPALKSLDRLDNVIYIGSFSKSLSPHLRISYMVLPDELIKIYHKKMPFMTCPVPNLSQLTLAKFMEDGYFERHLNKMRNIYDEKRNYIVELLKDYENFKLIDSKAGFHFILEIDTDKSERELVKLAREKDIYIQGLEEYYTSKLDYKKPRLIIGFGSIPKSDLESGLKILIEAWK